MGFLDDLWDSALAVGSAVLGVAVVKKGIDVMTGESSGGSSYESSSSSEGSSSEGSSSDESGE